MQSAIKRRCNNNYYKFFLSHSDEQSQLVQAACPVSLATNNLSLESKHDFNLSLISIDDMSDVQVMLDQFTISNPIWDRKIEQIKLQKAKRQLERIRNGK